MTILIGDQSETIREKIKTLLLEVRQFITTIEATNSQEVLEKTYTYQPKLVIFNFQIPGGTGIKTLLELKALNPTPLVMVLTAFTSSEYQSACLDAGADYFFDKAFEIEQMAITLHRLLNDSQRSL